MNATATTLALLGMYTQELMSSRQLKAEAIYPETELIPGKGGICQARKCKAHKKRKKWTKTGLKHA